MQECHRPAQQRSLTSPVACSSCPYPCPRPSLVTAFQSVQTLRSCGRAKNEPQAGSTCCPRPARRSSGIIYNLSQVPIGGTRPRCTHGAGYPGAWMSCSMPSTTRLPRPVAAPTTARGRRGCAAGCSAILRSSTTAAVGFRPPAHRRAVERGRSRPRASRSRVGRGGGPQSNARKQGTLEPRTLGYTGSGPRHR